MTVEAYKEDEKPLVDEDYVTTCPLMSHGLIDDISITIGDTTLDRSSTYYSLISYLDFLIDKTPKEKSSRLNFYEGKFLKKFKI